MIEGVAAYSAQPQESIVTMGGQRSKIGLVQVETNLLQVFGVKLLLGPTFPLAAASCHNCLVLSYQAWRHNFAGDPNILRKKRRSTARMRSSSESCRSDSGFPPMTWGCCAGGTKPRFHLASRSA